MRKGNKKIASQQIHEEEIDDIEDSEDDDEEEEIDDDANEENKQIIEEEDEESDDNDEEEDDIEEDTVPTGGFTITTDPTLENYHPEKILKKVQEKKKEKKQKEAEIVYDDKNLPAPKVIKPFDYEKLRKEVKQMGTVFVQKTHAHVFPRTSDVKNYFAKFGNITKVEPNYRTVNKFNHEKGKTDSFKAIAGYYVQFDDKNDAKKLALMMNGQPMNMKNATLLSIRYLPNFDFSTEVSAEEDKKTMLQKLMKAQAQKELRTIKKFQKNKNWSQKIQNSTPEEKHKIEKSMKMKLKYKQKRVDTQKNDDNYSNLSLLNE